MKRPILPRFLAAAFALALSFFAGSCATQQTVIQVPTNVNLPKKIKVVAQSCDANVMYQTVIDLENNEIVILIYNEMNLLNVIRTGIQADAKDQPPVTGADAPSAATTQERLKYGGKKVAGDIRGKDDPIPQGNRHGHFQTEGRLPQTSGAIADRGEDLNSRGASKNRPADQAPTGGIRQARAVADIVTLRPVR